MPLDDLTHVTYARDGHLATITLDRPDARNAYTPHMVESLMRAFDLAEEDDEVRVVVLTGAGRAFSAGGDLKLMLDHEGMFGGNPVQLRSRYLEGIHKVPRRLARFTKPIVAAVNGAAIGAGLDLACMADIRVAAEGAQFGSTFVKVGLVPGDGGAYLLARVIGFPRALELILTGRLIDTHEALAMGLVNTVVPAEGALDEARRYANLIAANAPLAVRMARSACLRSWELPLDAALEFAATYQGIVQNSADHDEGVRAILERRAPVFKGQ